MKIISTQENLKNGLQIVSKIVGNNTTLPILNNLLFETENGLLKVSGTNLETGISNFIPCKIEVEGSFCVGVKTFNDLINNLSGNITLEVKDSELIVSTEHTNSRLKTLPTDDFPAVPKLENEQKIKLNSIEFKKALDQVLFAASLSETQPEISGVLFWFGLEKVLITATDRYRLAEYALKYSGGLEKKIIIPSKSVAEISRLLQYANGDDIEMVVTDTQVSVMINDIYLLARVIDGQYPDYQQIIPNSCNTEITLQKDQLLSSVRTSSVFSRAVGSLNIAYDASKQLLTINSMSHDIGESLIDIPVKIDNGEGVLIFNYKYLMDYLTHLSDDDIVIKIIDDNSPVIFVPKNSKDYLYLVMPIKQ